MKAFFFFIVLFCSARLFAQKERNANEFNQQASANKLFDVRYVEKPPLFAFGADSAKRFYFHHFKGYDSVLLKCIAKGDTAKYIRIYFSFIIDKAGMAYDVRFERVGATRYAKSELSKTLKYFNAIPSYFNLHLNKMMDEMPLWKPALQYYQPVDCRVHDYMQFWVGINPPGY
jgi:hypothetical protein